MLKPVKFYQSKLFNKKLCVWPFLFLLTTKAQAFSWLVLHEGLCPMLPHSWWLDTAVTITGQAMKGYRLWGVNRGGMCPVVMYLYLYLQTTCMHVKALIKLGKTGDGTGQGCD